MKLWQTRRHWNSWAKSDPYWAVLTDSQKKGNRWNKDDFFRTGEITVETDMAEILKKYSGLKTDLALDFGCGVGRITQALAKHFSRVIGVDISKDMIELARSHNRHPDRVDFIVNERSDLSRFENNSFSLVYSVITLQHMEPSYALNYIREFLRVTAIGGVIFFQIPVNKPAPRRSRPLTAGRRLWHVLNRILVMKPVMEMHCIPQESVLEVLRSSGATILSVHPYDATGSDILSYTYIAVKK